MKSYIRNNTSERSYLPISPDLKRGLSYLKKVTTTDLFFRALNYLFKIHQNLHIRSIENFVSAYNLQNQFLTSNYGFLENIILFLQKMVRKN